MQLQSLGRADPGVATLAQSKALEMEEDHLVDEYKMGNFILSHEDIGSKHL